MMPGQHMYVNREFVSDALETLHRTCWSICWSGPWGYFANQVFRFGERDSLQLEDCSLGISEGSWRRHIISPTHLWGLGNLTRVQCACLLACTINPNAFTTVSDKGGNYEFIQNAEIWLCAVIKTTSYQSSTSPKSEVTAPIYHGLCNLAKT